MYRRYSVKTKNDAVVKRTRPTFEGELGGAELILLRRAVENEEELSFRQEPWRAVPARIQKSMSLKYEPSSEPLYISAKYFNQRRTLELVLQHGPDLSQTPSLPVQRIAAEPFCSTLHRLTFTGVPRS